MHMGVALLVLLAIGALMNEEMRGNPLTWLIAGLILLGAAGLVYRWWLGISADQAMVDLEKRSRR